MTVTIWHNPHCSKSRQTLALIEEKSITPTIRLYLEDAPSADELREVLTMLGLSPKELMRSGEDAFKAQNLSMVDDNEKLIAAMVATPKIIERPIVVAGNKARVGRPPESVLEIF